MLKTKTLNSMNITAEELGKLLEHFEFTGFFSDTQAKRVFCSCGYEGVKPPINKSYAEFICPQCKGKLIREYGWKNKGSKIFRLEIEGDDTLNFYSENFTFEPSADKSQFIPKLSVNKIAYMKKDSDGNVVNTSWSTENFYDCNFDEALKTMRVFFKDNSRFAGVLENYEFMKNFTSFLLIRTLIEGIDLFPNIFCKTSIKKKPYLVRDFVKWGLSKGFVYPVVDSDSIEKLPWTEGEPIPSDITIEDISRIFGCPDELFPFNDEIQFLQSNKTVFNYKDISKFFKTPLGIVALNRYMNEIIDWDEMIRMYFVGIALRENTLYKNASNYSYSPYKPSRSSEMFSADELSIFMDYFRDSIDRYMEIFSVIQHFQKNIEFLRSAGFIPDENNIRDRVCNSIRNSQKYKTLKGTDIQELMKSDPLEAAARLRGLL